MIGRVARWFIMVVECPRFTYRATWVDIERFDFWRFYLRFLIELSASRSRSRRSSVIQSHIRSKFIKVLVLIVIGVKSERIQPISRWAIVIWKWSGKCGICQGFVQVNPPSTLRLLYRVAPECWGVLLGGLPPECCNIRQVDFKLRLLDDYWAISAQILHRSQSEQVLLWFYFGYDFGWPGTSDSGFGRPTARSEIEVKIFKNRISQNRMPLLDSWTWDTPRPL